VVKTLRVVQTDYFLFYQNPCYVVTENASLVSLCKERTMFFRFTNCRLLTTKGVTGTRGPHNPLSPLCSAPHRSRRGGERGGRHQGTRSWQQHARAQAPHGEVRVFTGHSRSMDLCFLNPKGGKHPQFLTAYRFFYLDSFCIESPPTQCQPSYTTSLFQH